MWGIGVTSLIMLTSSPAACSARIAASRPEPGPFTYTSTVFSPCSIAALAAVSAAVCAANGVDFLEPLKPRPPALAQLERIALYVGDGHDGIVEGGLDMSRATFDIFASHGVCEWLFSLLLLPSQLSLPDYFFLLAIVFFGPLRVLALVLVRCPLTGRPLL